MEKKSNLSNHLIILPTHRPLQHVKGIRQYEQGHRMPRFAVVRALGEGGQPWPWGKIQAICVFGKSHIMSLNETEVRKGKA